MPAQGQVPYFIDNPVILGREGHYLTVDVAVPAILESWRLSLFSYEWMQKDGRLKAPDELPPQDRERFHAITDSLKCGAPLERPILGIGLMDNVEIGSGRATFLTLAALGYDRVAVHIPKTHEKEFAPFRI
jgi:hypothetical protein